jgi:hypothetical protein
VTIAGVLAMSCESSTPTAPMRSVVNSTQGPAAATAFADGRYSVTMAADRACGQLPPSASPRVYPATAARDGASSLTFVLTLGGDGLYPDHRSVSGEVAGNAMQLSFFNSDPFAARLEYQPFYERLTPRSYVAFSGMATVSLSPGAATVDGPFDGFVAYCSEMNASPAYPPTCAVPVLECRSSRHSLTMTRY